MLLSGEGCSRSQPSAEIILLLTDFGGSVPHDPHVKENLLRSLRQQLGQVEAAKVKELGRAITKEEGSQVARDEGRKNHAVIVVWGWYKMDAETVLLDTFLEVLRPPHYPLVLK